MSRTLPNQRQNAPFLDRAGVPTLPKRNLPLVEKLAVSSPFSSALFGERSPSWWADGSELLPSCHGTIRGAQDMTAGAHGVTAGAHGVTKGAHGVTKGAHGVTKDAHGVTKDAHGVTKLSLIHI